MSNQTITFTALEDTHTSYKGRYLRFVGKNTNCVSMNGKTFRLVTGAYGICYRVNGATLYIGIQEKMLLPPLKFADVTRLNYHLTIVPSFDSRWEIETTKNI